MEQVPAARGPVGSEGNSDNQSIEGDPSCACAQQYDDQVHVSDATTAVEAVSPAHAEQHDTPGRRSRRRKAKTKHCRPSADVEETSTKVDAPTSSASAASSVSQQLGTDREWAGPLMRVALACAERGDANESLEALMRLLLHDHTLTLPRASLFSLDFQRVVGGWQVTICLGDGRELAGAVRPSKSSATRAAIAEARTFVVNTLHHIATAALGRVSLEFPSSASSPQAPRSGRYDG